MAKNQPGIHYKAASSVFDNFAPDIIDEGREQREDEELPQSPQSSKSISTSLKSGNLVTDVETYDPLKMPPDLTLAKRHSKKLEEEDEDESHYCPCCNHPYEAQRFPLWCAIQDLSELGEGFPLYYHTVRSVTIALVVAMLISGVYCLNENYDANLISEWDETLSGSKVMESSLANFGKTGSPSVTQPWLHVGCMCLFLLLHFYLANKHKDMRREFDKRVITPSDYTCMFSHLPHNLDIGDFQTFIESLLPNGKICSINLAYSVSEYMKVDSELEKLKQRRNKLRKLRSETGIVTRTRRILMFPGPHDTLEMIDQSIQADEEKKRLLKGSLENAFCGIAFVTYEQERSKSYAVAKEVQRTYGTKKATGLQAVIEALFWCVEKKKAPDTNVYHSSRFTVKRAPEPNNIMWANLGVIGIQISRSFKKKRRIITYLATGVLLLTCAGVIYCSSLSKEAINDWKAHTTHTSFWQDLLFGVIIFLPSILIIVINMVITYTIQKFSKLEMHQTSTTYESAVAVKLSISMFLNTAVVVLILHWGDWYGPAGLTQEVYNILIANALVQPIFAFLNPTWIHKKLGQWLAQKRGERCLLSQQESHLLFEGLPLDMADRSANFIQTYLLTLFYAPILPLSYPIGVVALFLQYWTDKFMLLRVHARPEALSGQLDENLLRFLALGTVLYAVTNLCFYKELNDAAIVPGIVGLVTTCAYNFVPLTKIFKAIKRRYPAQAIVKCATTDKGADNEKKYEEVMVDFVDVSCRQDYDRCNPVTEQEGKRRWIQALRRRQIGIVEYKKEDLFPGAESFEPQDCFQPLKKRMETLKKKQKEAENQLFQIEDAPTYSFEPFAKKMLLRRKVGMMGPKRDAPSVDIRT